MKSNAVRTGVCPYKDYDLYKKNLESSGYKILEAHELTQDTGTLVMFTYIKVHKAGVTMLSQ